MEVGALHAKLALDMREFKKSMGEAKSDLSGLKAKLNEAERGSSGLARGLGVVATAVGAFSLKSVAMAGSLEQTKIAFTTMLGSAEKADAFIKELYDFAAKTPFEIAGITDAARSLMAYGFEAERVLPIMTSVGNAVSALGGGEFEIQRVTRALGQMQAKGKVSAEEMMQLAELGLPVWQMLADNIGISIPEAMDKASKGGISAAEGINAILEGMNEKFPNMMDKQSQTLLGIWSNTKDMVSQIMVELGDEIIQTFDLKGRLKTVVDSLATLKDLLSEKGLAGIIEEMSIVTKTAIVAIAGGITVALIPAFIALGTAIWTAMAPLLPFIAVGAALAGVAYLIHDAWSSNLFGIRSKAEAVASAVSSYFQTMIALVLGAFNTLKVHVFNVFQSILDAIRPVVGVIGEVAPSFEKSFNAAEKAVKTKGGQAAKEVELQASKFKKASADFKSAIEDTNKAFSSWKTPQKIKDAPEADDYGYKTNPTETAETSNSIESFASKAAKSAEEMKAAWEVASDALKVKLSQLKTSFDITNNTLEMSGLKSEQLQAKMASLNDQISVQKQVVAEVSGAYQDMVDSKQETTEEGEKLKLKLLEEQKALSDLEKQLFDTNKALDAHKQDIADLATEIDALEEKYKKDMAEALDDYNAKVAEVNENVRKQEQETTDAYENALKDRTKSLSNFVGLFEAVTNKKVSGSELLNNLKGQVDAFSEWADNIQNLAQRGVDEGLIDELRQMGAKAGPEIAALNTLTDEELTQYVALWKEKNRMAKEEATRQLEEQRIAMQDKLMQIRMEADEQLQLYLMEWKNKNAEIQKNTDTELSKIQDKFKQLAKDSTKFGQDFVLGFVGGMESKFETLRKAVAELSSITATGVTEPLGISSPSKLMAQYGRNTVEGFMSGIRSMVPKLEGIMNGMASLSMKPIEATAGGSVVNNNSGGNTIVFNVNRGWDEIERQLAKRGIKLGVR